MPLDIYGLRSSNDAIDNTVMMIFDVTPTPLQHGLA